MPEAEPFLYERVYYAFYALYLICIFGIKTFFERFRVAFDRYSNGKEIGRCRKTIPFTAIKESASQNAPVGAPLLEMECNAGVHALVTKRTCPVRIHGAISRATLPAHNDPIKFRDPGNGYGTQKGLTGEESDFSRDIEENGHTFVSAGLILDRSSHPNVVPSVPPVRWKHGHDTLWTFGQNLPIQVIALPDDVPCSLSPLRRDLTVEKVPHAHAENATAAE
jgi:hypothetical protein